MNPSDEISVKVYVETLFKAHEKEHVLLREAIVRAEKLMDIRLESMNELRRQLDKQAGTFATKDTVHGLQRFQDKFIGFILGVGALNALVTYLIVKIMGH